MDQLLAGLRAAGEPTRLRLLALLAHSELTVTELTQILRQSQPRVSRHLKLLCEAGLLERFREGSWVFYRLAGNGPVAELAEVLSGLIPQEDLIIARDMERLEAVRLALLLLDRQLDRRPQPEAQQLGRALELAAERRVAAVLHLDVLDQLELVGQGGRQVDPKPLRLQPGNIFSCARI